MNKGIKMEVPFTQVANCVLNDENLSFKAKGLFAYLYSKPDNWDFSYKRIAKDSLDGEDGVLAGLKELENAGYLLRRKLQSGKVEYEVVHSKFPSRENPSQGKSQTGKIGTISNKEIKQERIISNKEDIILHSDLYKSHTNDINLLIKQFEKVNPFYDKFFANRTQRKACEDLLSKFSFNDLSNTIEYYLSIKEDKYTPVITTPLQLMNKIGALHNAMVKSQSKGIPVC